MDFLASFNFISTDGYGDVDWKFPVLNRCMGKKSKLLTNHTVCSHFMTVSVIFVSFHFLASVLGNHYFYYIVRVWNLEKPQELFLLGTKQNHTLLNY